MTRKEKALARRNEFLFAHMDGETANYFISLWDDSSEEVCEEKISAEKVSREKVFANNSRNKLSEYGNSVALTYLLSIPEVERAIKFARFDFEDLKESLRKGFASEEQKQNFISKRSVWFSHLKDRMRELRISKETLQTFGLDWKSAKNFAYQTI